MKAIKSLIAVSVLAAAGAANAATVATFSGDAAASINLGIEIVTATSGTATAVLDDAGTLTVTAKVNVATLVGTNNTLDIIEKYTGTWDGTTFTATGGTQTYTGCTEPADAVPGCTSIAVGAELPAAMSGSLTLAGGSLSAAQTDANSGAVSSYTYTFGPGTPAVPVPAAAWLFGSGLLGLAGTARRRSV